MQPTCLTANDNPICGRTPNETYTLTMHIMTRLKLSAAMLLLPVVVPAQMPIVRLNGNFGNEYTAGSMTVTDGNGVTTEYHVKSKWRGHTAKQYDKKAFAVKLTDSEGNSADASLLGMREDNNWILDAMAADKARMRNRVSFDLWNDFAEKSFIKKEYEPESTNGTHGKFVEMYLNGSYHGIYCMTEKIDRKQLKLKKYKDGARGILYKADTWDGTGFWSYTDYDNSQPTWMGWESQYPDVEDDGDTDYGLLHDAIKFTVEASTEAFAAGSATRFDLPVWNDYFIFIKLILAIDNHGKNTFTYIYDKTKDHRLGIAPWDLDATWGRNFDGTELSCEMINDGHHLLDRLKEQEDYMKQAADRYFALRKTTFDADSLKQRFRNYFDYFRNNGAAQREIGRWNGVNGVELDFDSEQQYIESWIDSRLHALDNYFGNYTTNIAYPREDKEYGDGHYTNLNGQKTGKAPITKGIYIRDGKKYILK